MARNYLESSLDAKQCNTYRSFRLLWLVWTIIICQLNDYSQSHFNRASPLSGNGQRAMDSLVQSKVGALVWVGFDLAQLFYDCYSWTRPNLGCSSELLWQLSCGSQMCQGGLGTNKNNALASWSHCTLCILLPSIPVSLYSVGAVESTSLQKE